MRATETVRPGAGDAHDAARVETLTLARQFGMRRWLIVFLCMVLVAAALGHCHRGAGYHNPDNGRFWTMDSFEGFGSDPASLHKYTYCGNNPGNVWDPSGYHSYTEETIVTAMAPTVRGWLLSVGRTVISKFSSGMILYELGYPAVFYPKATMAIMAMGLGLFIADEEFRGVYMSAGGNPVAEINYLVSEIQEIRVASAAARRAFQAAEAAALEAQEQLIQSRINVLKMIRLQGLAWDPGRQVFDYSEAAAALRLENQIGQYLQRTGAGAAGDYIAPARNTAFDMIFTDVSAESKIPQMIQSLKGHLLKQGVKTVIDYSRMTVEQAQAIRDFVDSLPAVEQAKIVILQ